MVNLTRKGRSSILVTDVDRSEWAKILKPFKAKWSSTDDGYLVPNKYEHELNELINNYQSDGDREDDQSDDSATDDQPADASKTGRDGDKTGRVANDANNIDDDNKKSDQDDEPVMRPRDKYHRATSPKRSDRGSDVNSRPPRTILAGYQNRGMEPDLSKSPVEDEDVISLSNKLRDLNRRVARIEHDMNDKSRRTNHRADESSRRV